MCGICGKLNFSEKPVSLDLVRDMNQTLKHRGPDEEGFYFSVQPGLGMAMRRLKIIDLATGSQPIFNETRDIAVILNGEIYNYIEIRKELEKLGHIFTTHSDTEVLVHAYEAFGLNFLNVLNGMFAFALWDEQKQQLLLARDRMGIKPLYYRQNAKGLSFSSEIKALLKDPECPKDLDALALDDYFSVLYIPTPNSVFKAIKKLEPGHYLLCDLKKKTLANEAYWQHPLILNPPDLGWAFYEQKLDTLFKDILKLQMRADVPNGLFLSSGLDSGTIAYYASQISSQKVNSFTMDFPESSYSECQGARSIAQACGCMHHEMPVESNIEELILKTTDFFDEPFADSSAIPTYLLCELARKNIVVALSGEGGDELFAGYPTYLATRLAPYYRKWPGPIRHIFSRLVQKLPISWERLSWEYKLKEFTRGAQYVPEKSHYAWKEIFTPDLKHTLYEQSFLQATQGHDSFESFKKIFEKAGHGIELEKLLYVDQQTYLADQFLVKSDRMSMAHSLEVRVPILDHRMVEFAAEIPAHYKLRGFTTKWALRKLMQGKLPESVIWGSKKGFSPPIAYWISGKLRRFVEAILAPESIRKTGILRADAVGILLKEHLSKKRDHHRRIWAILNFILWHRKWGTP
jgi:asparagine synthase (glutamine-hydrolysing)